MDKKKIIWSVFGLFLILVLMLAFYLKNRSKMDGIISYNFSNPNTVQLTKSRIIAEEEGNLILIDHDGKESVLVDQARYEYDCSANRIYVLMENQLEIYDDQGKEIKKVSLENTYDQIMAQEYSVTLIADHEQVTYNENGELLLKYKDEQALMTLGVSSKNNKYQAYSSLKSTNNRYASILALYKEKEQVFQHELVDQIILSLDYVDDKLFVLTQKAAYIFVEGNIEAQIMFDKIMASALTKDKLFVIDNEELIVYDFEGKRLDKIPLARDYRHLLSTMNDIVLYYENSYASYDTNKIVDFPISEKIYQAIQVEDRIYLVYKNKIERIL